MHDKEGVILPPIGIEKLCQCDPLAWPDARAVKVESYLQIEVCDAGKLWHDLRCCVAMVST